MSFYIYLKEGVSSRYHHTAVETGSDIHVTHPNASCDNVANSKHRVPSDLKFANIRLCNKHLTSIYHARIKESFWDAEPFSCKVLVVTCGKLVVG